MQLEGVNRHAGPEQPGARLELVLDATSVGLADRFEAQMLEPLQPEVAGCGLVETPTAQLPLAALHRPVVHDVVGGAMREGRPTFAYERGAPNRSATCLARRASSVCGYIEVVALEECRSAE